ncbi:hypothetical protein SFRURICE_020917 [Spodoptera frugiperda]|nr:hypothetical protein SFRURICE_020917 [Spodoptera frugiperda]
MFYRERIILNQNDLKTRAHQLCFGWFLFLIAQERRVTISGYISAGLRTTNKGSSPPDQNQTVRRVAFHARFKEPSDDHVWGPVGRIPDPELRTT